MTTNHQNTTHSTIKPHYLKDYTEPNYWVSTVNLTFEIDDNSQVVYVDNVTKYHKNINKIDNILELDGDTKLISVKVNDVFITEDKYTLENNILTLKNLPSEFILSIKNEVYPWQNKTCMGLYETRGDLMTQCEAHGFRNITYYQDRPDVMGIFTVNIRTHANKYTTILSNGNQISQNINNGMRETVWHDPFKKPSYLFALVIGNLSKITSQYVTRSHREVLLEVYAHESHLDHLNHAMQSIKNAMRWDEDRFSLEYDLDRYMVVASSDFNMGAMENKGLNIFNTKYVLASPDTATDTDYMNVEAVIGHEYFHNWTGNRVTCKNWFQLSLKEGLTVFRDQEFSADLHNRTIQRIKNVKTLRRAQFPEDAGPLAHPVQPQSYIVMDNFYSVTVYEKGAEVVRMYQTILGKGGFERGLALYLQRHDGQAVTVEDFKNSMMDANNFDLSQFMLWYSQAGTPHIHVTDEYNFACEEYTLHFTQMIPNTPDNKTGDSKKPHLIPIKIGFLDGSGYAMDKFQITTGRYIWRAHDDKNETFSCNNTKNQDKNQDNQNDIILLLDDAHNKFTFSGIKTKPTPSLLQEFSAPVKLHYPYTLSQHMLIINHDYDEFNRFEHLQILFINQIINIYHALLKNEEPVFDKQLTRTLQSIVNNVNLSPEFRALMLTIPTFSDMITEIENIHPVHLTHAIQFVISSIGEEIFDSLLEQYNLNLDTKYSFNNHGRRAFKNSALFYLIHAMNKKLPNNHTLQLIETLSLGQLHNSDNMTDTLGVLTAINNTPNEIRHTIFDEFYNKWHDNELVMDKWFMLQATSSLVNISQLNKLMVDKAFIATNPNKIYALLMSFTTNSGVFHTPDGYSFIIDQIIAIDKFNPTVAARLMSGFNQIAQLNDNYKQTAKDMLQKVIKHSGISDNILELVEKIISNI